MSTKQNETIDAKAFTKNLDEKMNLGALIRAFREAEEISQVNMAEQLGVSKQFLSDVENGRKKVGIPLIQKFATELGFSPDTFVRVYLRDQLREAGMKGYDVHLVKHAS